MCLNAGAMGRLDAESETLIPVNRCGFDVAHALRAEGFDASEDGTGTPLVPVPFDTTQITSKTNRSNPQPGDPCHTLAKGANPPAIAIQAGALRENPNSGPDGVGVQEGIAYTLEARAEVQSIAFDMRGREGGAMPEGPHDTANIRAASGGSSRSYVAQEWAVRRLTPLECERLQGFPDGYTAIPRKGGKPAADGPRYKALGNSMAVNVMRWIGQRVSEVEALP